MTERDIDVLATFEDMASARRAIHALGLAGIEAGSVSVIGPAAAEAAAERDTSERDREVARTAMKGTAKGAAAGGAAGTIAGLVAAVIPGVGPVVGVGALMGAIAGAGVGGVVGGVASIDLSDAWELTYASVRDGRVVVGVNTEDDATARRVMATLRRQEPLAIRRA